MASFILRQSNPNMILLLGSPVRVLRGFPLLSTKTLAMYFMKGGSTVPFRLPATSIVQLY